jgi:GTP-binding protein HflX
MTDWRSLLLSKTSKPENGRLYELEPKGKTALLIGIYETTDRKPQCLEQLDELESLAATYGFQGVVKLPSPLRECNAATFLGKGKVEEIRNLVEETQCEIVIFDHEITPQQQRNLEKIFERIVIDRTELILGVFAQRAQTSEAKLQVELASVRYQMPRLRRLWTHLSRQRTGGAGGGFLKGEGEKQIEIDRQILKHKSEQIQKELEEVKKHRQTQRRERERTGIPMFAIIGYTNVGKSTLMNALTDANVLVEDKLFATLDTTTRKYILPNRQSILLVDTVGFIRKIPHQLIAAFKSTLEEAVRADILLHLIDVSNPIAFLQAEATIDILKELGAAKLPMITVLNKIDQCKSRQEIDRLRFHYPKTVEISALKKTGIDRLLELMIQEIANLRKRVHLRVPQSEYAALSEVLQEGKVLSRDYEDNDILLAVEIPCRLEQRVAKFLIEPPFSC